jgi:hypothetical protein
MSYPTGHQHCANDPIEDSRERQIRPKFGSCVRSSHSCYQGIVLDHVSECFPRDVYVPFSAWTDRCRYILSESYTFQTATYLRSSHYSTVKYFLLAVAFQSARLATMLLPLIARSIQ